MFVCLFVSKLIQSLGIHWKNTVNNYMKLFVVSMIHSKFGNSMFFTEVILSLFNHHSQEQGSQRHWGSCQAPPCANAGAQGCAQLSKTHGQEGQGSGELDTSPAMATMGPGLMAPGADMGSWALGCIWRVPEGQAEALSPGGTLKTLVTGTQWQGLKNKSHIFSSFPVLLKFQHRYSLTQIRLNLLEWNYKIDIILPQNFLINQMWGVLAAPERTRFLIRSENLITTQKQFSRKNGLMVHHSNLPSGKSWHLFIWWNLKTDFLQFSFNLIHYILFQAHYLVQY